MFKKIKYITKLKNETGAMAIVEGAIVFPVVFFTIAFLIYLGNALYEKSRIDSIVMSCAILGAQYAADPYNSILLANDVDKDPSKFPTADKEMFESIRPYRYLFGVGDIEDEVEGLVYDKITQGSMIFFKKESSDVLGVSAKMENHIFNMSFTVSADYTYNLPFEFAAMELPPLITISSKATVGVNDSDEFIRNTDMAIDFFTEFTDKTNVGKQIKVKISNLSSFFKKFGKQ